ncbi:MAG: transcription elongation factor GreA [Chloroflexi bacterium]|nr:MAG: transcription elongation factor GreA [Chloroflexota bacterium]
MSERENKPVYLTAEGAESLRQELEHLVNVKRPELAERLHKAIQQGDLSENADYIAAKEEQGFLEGRIQEIEAMLRKAVIIEEEDGPKDVVVLGSRVTIVEKGIEEVETFRIVGPAEANPTTGNVSNESPLGQALLGRRVGDTVTVEAPAGEIVFRIVAIQ